MNKNSGDPSSQAQAPIKIDPALEETTVKSQMNIKQPLIEGQIIQEKLNTQAEETPTKIDEKPDPNILKPPENVDQMEERLAKEISVELTEEGKK